MRQILQTFFTSVSILLRKRSYITNTFPQFWYGTGNIKSTSEEELKGLLQARFPDAKIITVEDVSGGCGAMYNIYVETKDFKSLPIAKQHQAIYTALHEKIKLIHGLHVVTKAPP